MKSYTAVVERFRLGEQHGRIGNLKAAATEIPIAAQLMEQQKTSVDL